MVLSVAYKLLVRNAKYKRSYAELPFSKISVELRFGPSKSAAMTIKELLTEIYQSVGNGVTSLTSFREGIKNIRCADIFHQWELQGNREDDADGEFMVMNGKEYVKFAGPNYKSKTYEPDCIITKNDKSNPGGYYGKIAVLITLKSKYYKKCMFSLYCFIYVFAILCINYNLFHSLT